MNKMLTLLGGLGVGAGLMYLLDPDRGRHRRSQIRDKAVHTFNQWDASLERKSHDLSNRTYGLLSEARSFVKPEDVSDETLVARVRAAIGHHILHAHSIDVVAYAGWVTLRGPILADAVPELVACVEAVPGVTRVNNLLTVLHTPEEMSSMQEAIAARRPTSREQVTMCPTTRVLAGILGGMLVMKAVKREGLLGSVLNMAGLGVIARSLVTPNAVFLETPPTASLQLPCCEIGSLTPPVGIAEP
jgi:osmotically-inducible protein OsmY